MLRLGHKYGFEAWKEEAVLQLEKRFPGENASPWFKADWPQDKSSNPLVLHPDDTFCDLVNVAYQMRLNKCLPSMFLIAIVLQDWPVGVLSQKRLGSYSNILGGPLRRNDKRKREACSLSTRNSPVLGQGKRRCSQRDAFTHLRLAASQEDVRVQLPNSLCLHVCRCCSGCSIPNGTGATKMAAAGQGKSTLRGLSSVWAVELRTGGHDLLAASTNVLRLAWMGEVEPFRFRARSIAYLVAEEH